MSVHKDKKRGTWYFRVRVGDKHLKRRSKDWTLKRHAVEAERGFLSNQKKGQLMTDETSFKQLTDNYIEYCKLNRKSSTIGNNKRAIKNQILPFFENKKISNVTLHDVEQFQQYLLNLTYTRNGETKHYSDSYLASIQSMTNSIFDYAVKHRIILYNPFFKVESVRSTNLEAKRKINIITKEEYLKFDNAIKDITDKTLFSVLYYAGLRIGEALGLNISDYNIETKTLHVQHNYNSHSQELTTTKTDNDRYVVLPDVCADRVVALINSYKNAKTDDGPLFGFPLRLSKSSLDRRKKEYIDNSGAPYFTFHDLRHTHVSTLIQLGMRDIDIADRLGHSVEMVNNVYGHLFPADKKNILKTINKL